MPIVYSYFNIDIQDPTTPANAPAPVFDDKLDMLVVACDTENPDNKRAYIAINQGDTDGDGADDFAQYELTGAIWSPGYNSDGTGKRIVPGRVVLRGLVCDVDGDKTADRTRGRDVDLTFDNSGAAILKYSMGLSGIVAHKDDLKTGFEKGRLHLNTYGKANLGERAIYNATATQHDPIDGSDQIMPAGNPIADHAPSEMTSFDCTVDINRDGIEDQAHFVN